MVSLEKVYANYLDRKFVVISITSLTDVIKNFYGLDDDSIVAIDNFFDLNNLDKETKAYYYKPKFGFLGPIEVIKDFCQGNNIIFLEDFTENFSANKIIDGKCLYAGMFGVVSVCVIDNVFFYATNDEKLAECMHSAAIELKDSQKAKLIEYLFEVEVTKRRRRVTVANYLTLIAYLGLFHFLTPIDECNGEAASYPVFAVTAKNESDLLQYLKHADVQIALWNSFLLFQTDVTENSLKNIMELISKFYKEVFL